MWLLYTFPPRSSLWAMKSPCCGVVKLPVPWLQEHPLCLLDLVETWLFSEDGASPSAYSCIPPRGRGWSCSLPQTCTVEPGSENLAHWWLFLTTAPHLSCEISFETGHICLVAPSTDLLTFPSWSANMLPPGQSSWSPLRALLNNPARTLSPCNYWSITGFSFCLVLFFF